MYLMVRQITQHNLIMMNSHIMNLIADLVLIIVRRLQIILNKQPTKMIIAITL